MLFKFLGDLILVGLISDFISPVLQNEIRNGELQVQVLTEFI